jgi:hypothetical protein
VLTPTGSSDLEIVPQIGLPRKKNHNLLEGRHAAFVGARGFEARTCEFKATVTPNRSFYVLYRQLCETYVNVVLINLEAVGEVIPGSKVEHGAALMVCVS